MTRPAGPFCFDDLEAMPDDGYRREIIEGCLIVTPAPNYAHQRAQLRLGAILLAAETRDARVVTAPFDWKHPDGGSVEPDLVVMRLADVVPKGPLGPSATPLLVVEVLSPSRPLLDTALKRALYERLGVPAYWMVDPIEPSIVALRLAGDRYQVEAEIAGEEEFVTEWPFPVRFRPAELPQ